MFERTAQKEKNSSKIITQDIRRRKNLPFLDIIPTAPEKTQVHEEKEDAFIRNGRENQSRKTKKPRRLDLPRSTLPRISCRRQEGAGFSEGGFSPAVILSGAIAEHPRRGRISVLPLLVILRSAATKDLGLEPGKTKNEILRAVKPTLRMTPKSSHSERSGGTKTDLHAARNDCNTPNNQKGGIIP